MTLACEDANSNLTEVVTVADVDADKRVGNSLLQFWELRFGHRARFFVEILKLMLGPDSEDEFLSRFV